MQNVTEIASRISIVEIGGFSSRITRVHLRPLEDNLVLEYLNPSLEDNLLLEYLSHL